MKKNAVWVEKDNPLKKKYTYSLLRRNTRCQATKKANSTQTRTSTPGILRYKTMANKLMYIPNDDTQNYLFCRLQYMVGTFGQST